MGFSGFFAGFFVFFGGFLGFRKSVQNGLFSSLFYLMYYTTVKVLLINKKTAVLEGTVLDGKLAPARALFALVRHIT